MPVMTRRFTDHEAYDTPTDSPLTPMRSPKSGGTVSHQQQDQEDTFHGVRDLPAKSTRVIVVSVCLTDTIHSQGFSPSQRFDPTMASQLYFTLHPPIGF